MQTPMAHLEDWFKWQAQFHLSGSDKYLQWCTSRFLMKAAQGSQYPRQKLRGNEKHYG
jgi:hypothetical protein